jgi:hypothetical protein
MISAKLLFLIVTFTYITYLTSCLPIDENENLTEHHKDSTNHQHNQFSVNNCDG